MRSKSTTFAAVLTVLATTGCADNPGPTGTPEPRNVDVVLVGSADHIEGLMFSVVGPDAAEPVSSEIGWTFAAPANDSTLRVAFLGELPGGELMTLRLEAALDAYRIVIEETVDASNAVALDTTGFHLELSSD